MCGIIGYIGKQNPIPILVDGLKRMEYRGYDSAGISYVEDNENIKVIKTSGKIKDLDNKIREENNLHDGQFRIGIGHTRWATHGIPNEINAHPHIDTHGTIAVVHNGIIENFSRLRTHLEKKGHLFRSDTDTEVIAHLISENMDGDLEEAVRKTLRSLEGTYGLAIISKDEPDKIVIARKGSPIVIGEGKGENLVASDVAALIRYTPNVIYLEDGEMGVITRDTLSIKDLDNVMIRKKVDTVDWKIEDTDLNGYPSYMYKEIYEQPQSLKNACAGRFNASEGTSVLGGLMSYEEKIRRAKRIIVLGMGTSYHAALLGEYFIEEFARVPVEVEYSAEFRYRGPIVDENTLVVAISQSGETADTLAALREAKLKGATVAGISNVVGSTIARETHCGVYMHAGPEIGVASTKCFTSEMMILAMIGLFIGRTKVLSLSAGRRIVSFLDEIPALIQDLLASNMGIEKLAKGLCDYDNFLFLGRGYHYPIALEGALKLKEISYVHAEGYNAAEMKHGPIALIDENMPVIVIAPQDSLYEKTISNIREVKARKGKVIAIATEGDTTIEKEADHVIYIPKVESFVAPFLSIVPLQLLAYYVAIHKGCDVDQPRNLAKSVTVE